MNIRYLLRSLVCVCLSFCIVFSSSFCALASTTTAQVYNVMPLDLYNDDEIISISTRASIGDYNLNSYSNSANGSSFNVITNTRFDASSGYISAPNIPISSLPEYTNSLRYTISLSNANGNDWLYADLLGLELDIHGLYFVSSYRHSPTSYFGSFIYSKNKPLKARYRAYRADGSLLTSGDINLNNISVNGNFLDVHLSIPKSSDVASTYACSSLDIYFEYYLNSYPTDTFDYFVSNVGFKASDSYLYGDFPRSNSSSTSSQDDYNKNVEAELGNIQTGINNVINSVVQMGNQAWQGAQQTVQAVTQMTQQLNTAIDTQRQDILNGLGLLGDDIGSSLTSVKSEITNIGTSITNKIQSTTETITNTIENKVDEVTSAVEDVKQSVTEVKQSIIDLPNKLKEMLTGFFVPNEQTINSKYSEFDTLLSDRFGLIYQSADIIHDFAESFQTQAVMTADTGGVITMPQVTVSLAGTPFTFGGYEVDIIPDGFETLQQMCRLAVSMVCTVVFINMLKEKLEWILR